MISQTDELMASRGQEPRSMGEKRTSDVGLVDVLSRGVGMLGGMARRRASLTLDESLQGSSPRGKFLRKSPLPEQENDLWDITSPESQDALSRTSRTSSQSSLGRPPREPKSRSARASSPINSAKQNQIDVRSPKQRLRSRRVLSMGEGNANISPISGYSPQREQESRPSSGRNGAPEQSPTITSSKIRSKSTIEHGTNVSPSGGPEVVASRGVSGRTPSGVGGGGGGGTGGGVHSRNSSRSSSVPLPRRGKNGVSSPSLGKSLVENAYVAAFAELSEDELFKLTRARVRGNSRWDFKGQIAKHEEVLKEVRGALVAVNEGRKRFRTVCAEIENSLQRELRDHKRLAQQSKQEREVAEAELQRLRTDGEAAARSGADLTRQLELLRAERDRLAAEAAALREEGRRRAAAHAELEVKAAHAEGRAAESAAQMGRCQAELKALQGRSHASSSEVEARWRERLEAATSALKEELAGLRARGAAKEEDLGRQTERARGVERDLAAARAELAALRSASREGQADRERAAGELERVRRELAATREGLDQKARELTMALESFAAMQKTSATREDEMRASLRAAEARAQTAEARAAAAAAELSALQASGAASSREARGLREKLEKARAEAMGAKEALARAAAEAARGGEQAAVERQLRERAEARAAEERTERTAATAQLMAMVTAHAADVDRLKREHRAAAEELETQLETAKADEAQLRKEAAERREEVVHLQSEVHTLKEALVEAADSCAPGPSEHHLEEMTRVAAEAQVLRERLRALEATRQESAAGMQERIAELEGQVLVGERKRRQLHNLVQELRGNIRVFVRVRPYLPSDNAPEGAPVAPEPNADGASLRLQRHDPGGAVLDQQPFAFDKVFPPSTGQEAVFAEVSEFVQSALDGFHVCLFSYGQTGSGKTHTMQGAGKGAMRGIIPRAMEQVGEHMGDMEAQGWQYEMKVSFLEIYNETIQDLLWPLADDPEAAKAKRKEIKRSPAGEIYVSDLTKVPLNPLNHAEIDRIMEIAARHRSVGSTDMNAHSSRSHSVFTLHLRATNLQKHSVMTGKLNLVDLAGSERLSRSGATGDRLKETQAINKSLSCLTDVFLAIARKNAHVPFRNSKLTHLLQPALSGDGKTLMMVNLSPTQDSFQESLSSLRFGSHVNQCELGKAKRHVQEVSDAHQDGSDDGQVLRRPASEANVLQRGGGGGGGSRRRPERTFSAVSEGGADRPPPAGTGTGAMGPPRRRGTVTLGAGGGGGGRRR